LDQAAGPPTPGSFQDADVVAVEALVRPSISEAILLMSEEEIIGLRHEIQLNVGGTVTA
jgi:hypothetical protein